MGEDGSRDEAGPLQTAARYVGGGRAPAPSHEESYDVRKARSCAEEGRLTQWAAENGKLGGKIPVAQDRGGEHTVSYNPKNNRYFKATRPDAKLGYGLAMTDSGLGATPSEYLDRLALNNKYFGDDVRLENVVRQNGKPVVVTSQSFINGDAATPRQVVSRLADGGFDHIAPGTFYNKAESVLAFDLYPKNAKFDGRHVLPIDPVMQRVTPDFADFIQKNWRSLRDYQNAEAHEWERQLAQIESNEDWLSADRRK